MTSQPPPAVGHETIPDSASSAEVESSTPEAGTSAAAQRTNGGRAGSERRSRPVLPVTPSSAPVELSLDLRATPPDKVLSRLFGALERVADDVTLIVLLRDIPEVAAAMTTAHQALRQNGYNSDTSRFPPGSQRLKIFRRRMQQPWRRPQLDASEEGEILPLPPEAGIEG
ncbi:MAG TPA: hypothetical protein VGW38_29345 [Chloroflexota bacterium]|nr:hypothetical protein [Chloroflexota bacterium]